MKPLRNIMADGRASSLPLDLILDTIPSLPRPLLARMVARMIDRLDQIDGDPDLEGQHDEDHLTTAFFLVDRGGPGCPIADPYGQCDEDEISTELGRVLAWRGPGCPIADDGR